MLRNAFMCILLVAGVEKELRVFWRGVQYPTLVTFYYRLQSTPCKIPRMWSSGRCMYAHGEWAMVIRGGASGMSFPRRLLLETLHAHDPPYVAPDGKQQSSSAYSGLEGAGLMPCIPLPSPPLMPRLHLPHIARYENSPCPPCRPKKPLSKTEVLSSTLF